jgi:putative copper export protein
LELGFAFVAALLFLAWLTERRWLLWPAFLLALGLGSGLSLSSHQADDRGWLPSFADWVHLSAATLWIGGLLSLGLVVWDRPRAEADRVLALLRDRRAARRARRRRRRLHDVRALPGAHDLWTVATDGC